MIFPTAFYDRVKESSVTPGTAAMVLGGALPSCVTFASVFSDGQKVLYAIDDNLGNWEDGEGTFHSAANTISRDTVRQSSNANAIVTFPAGGKTVRFVIISEWLNAVPTLGSPNTFQVPRVTKTANYVVAVTDHTVWCDPTSNTIAVTLPSPANVPNQRFAVVDSTGQASGHNITVAGAAGNINGAANYVISANYGYAVFESDGSNYTVVPM